jgi:uncharacterized protein (TIGR02646 family)
VIQVDRNRLRGDGTRIAPSNEWLEKANTAIAAWRNGDKPSAIPKYRDDSVVVALEELFHGKCAYCESSTARFDVNVEHYRPKGRVNEDKKHLGYYWLEVAWENLYPSCVMCNQLRTPRRFRGMSESSTARGKHDKFPLADPASRARSPAHDLAHEKRLLLDPCQDNPAAHLAYDASGAIFPLNGSAMGKASIDVYVLDATRLRNDRRKTLETLRALLKLLAAAKAKADAAAVTQIKKALDGLTADVSFFAGAARYARTHPEEFGA